MSCLRARLQRPSMREFPRCELKRLALWPSIGVWLQGVRQRNEAAETHVPLTSIPRERNAARM